MFAKNMLMGKRWARRGLVAAGLVWGAGLAPVAWAQTTAVPAPLRPLLHYLAPSDFSSAALSADGRYLAALVPVKGRRNLVVLDLDTRQSRAVTALSKMDVVSFNWVGSSYLVYAQGQFETPVGAQRAPGGPFAVRVDGSGFRDMKGAQFMRAVLGSEDEVLVSARMGKSRPDIYRMNLDNGQRQLLSFDKPGHVAGWLLDKAGSPRAVTTVDDPEAIQTQQTFTLWVRDTLESPWRAVASWKDEDANRLTARAFAPDDRNLIVEASPGRDTSALYIFDVQEKKLGEMIAGHPRYDATEATLRRNPATGVVDGLTLLDDRFQAAHFDAGLADLQAMLEKEFKGQAVVLQRTARSGRVLVSTWSDRQPLRYYLYDEGKKTLELLLRTRPTLEGGALVEMRPFLLKTRDGLEIPSYYFLPASYQPGQKLPTVVHIHGGPHVRADQWNAGTTFGVKEAQILASRGYAVVLPNFRMTPGLGNKIFQSGWGEYGRKMSDDHEDAARWAVAQGFADAKRICISGASYGGSAALWATIQSPDVFACAIAGLAVSDKKFQLTSTRTDYSGNDASVAFWKRILGVKGEDWGPADATAPAQHAARSRIPLFMYAGADDRRVPLEQTELMVDALKKAGRPPEVVMVKLEEGHGFAKREHQLELYEGILAFLARHIGTGPSPTP
jgi:dipeptidyl aminopeptidase/acylaminoacyl peptidase